MIKVKWNEVSYDLFGKAVWVKHIKEFTSFDEAFKYALTKNQLPYCYNVIMICE